MAKSVTHYSGTPEGRRRPNGHRKFKKSHNIDKSNEFVKDKKTLKYLKLLLQKNIFIFGDVNPNQFSEPWLLNWIHHVTEFTYSRSVKGGI
jgi:hypothetical protein